MRSKLVILLSLLGSVIAEAALITPPASAPADAIAADYSWTQLFSMEDPESLGNLSALANGLGPNVFLSTGNTGYNYLSQQLLVVGNPSDAEALVPEPGGLFLPGLGLLLAIRRKTAVQIEKFPRR